MKKEALPEITCVHCWRVQMDRKQGKCLHCNLPLVRKEAADASQIQRPNLQIAR